jgi:hypothetical protein
MSPPTPEQQLRRVRFESLIRLAAPFLDLVLVAGDRLSRVVGPDDEYLPVRAPSEAFELEAARAARRRAPARELAD